MLNVYNVDVLINSNNNLCEEEDNLTINKTKEILDQNNFKNYGSFTLWFNQAGDHILYRFLDLNIRF